jgi:hypothetical protein
LIIFAYWWSASPFGQYKFALERNLLGSKDLLQFPDSKDITKKMSETENPAVVEALAKMFPSDDPLDSVNFDVTQYINAMFPNEQSLSNLDEVIIELTERIELHEGMIQKLTLAF